MKNLFSMADCKQLKNRKLPLMQPSEFSLRFVLDFARAYQVKKIGNNQFLEVVLN
jgi:hypothetical protein